MTKRLLGLSMVVLVGIAFQPSARASALHQKQLPSYPMLCKMEVDFAEDLRRNYYIYKPRLIGFTLRDRLCDQLSLQ